MSSDGYFDDSDILDDAVFEQLDAIEAAHFSPKKPAPPQPKRLQSEDSYDDMTFDIDESELAMLDLPQAPAHNHGNTRPVAQPPARSASKGSFQTTLFGDVLQNQPSGSKPRAQIQRTKSAPRNPFGQQAPKTKQWDHTQFAKSGLKWGKKGKEKARDGQDEEGENFDEQIEFEQFPAPFVSREFPSNHPISSFNSPEPVG